MFPFIPPNLVVERDLAGNSIRQKVRETLPIYDVLPAIQPRGSLIYNKLSESSGLIYYSDGIAWVSAGTGSGISEIDESTGITVNNPTGPIATISITDIPGVAGMYTNTNLTVNPQGQITIVSNGTAPGIDELDPIIGGGLIVTGNTGPTATISIADTGVTGGSYTNTSLTVNESGLLTFASTGSLPSFDKSYAEYEGGGIPVTAGVPTTLAPLTVVGPASPNFNATTGIYTVPADGWYRMSANVDWGELATPSPTNTVTLTINSGSPQSFESSTNFFTSDSGYAQQGSYAAYLTAASTISAQVLVGVGVATQTITTGYLSIIQLA